MHRIMDRWFWGLVIVGVGVLFLLRQLDVLTFDFNIGYLFATYWPVFLIIPGLRGLLIQRRYSIGQTIGSLVMLVIGTAFLLQNLDLYVINWGSLFSYAGPVAIIVIGLSFLFRGSRKHEEHHREYADTDINDDNRYDRYARREARRQRREQRKYGYNPNTANEQHDGTAYEAKFGSQANYEAADVGQAGPDQEPFEKHDSKYKYYDPYEHVNTGTKKTLNKSNFIGDVYMGQEYWELQPLNISHFIGDTVIDLTKASIPYGETKISVSAFIGDVKIFIPQDMDVEVKVTASSFIGDQRVFNRREGGMFSNMNLQTDAYWEAPRKLRITVSMFIGDVVIQKVG